MNKTITEENVTNLNYGQAVLFTRPGHAKAVAAVVVEAGIGAMPGEAEVFIGTLAEYQSEEIDTETDERLWIAYPHELVLA